MTSTSLEILLFGFDRGWTKKIDIELWTCKANECEHKAMGDEEQKKNRKSPITFRERIVKLLMRWIKYILN